MQRSRNPYDFVPLESAPTPAPKPSLASVGECTGQIAFQLTTLTPLCIHNDPGRFEQIGSSKVYRFARLAEQPCIPATSLKGMLRGVHEALTNSTMGLLNARAWYAKPSTEKDPERIPEHYRPGGEILTASEALFGAVGASKQRPDGRAGRLLLDDIAFDKAILRRQNVSRPAGGQPKPAHESFYFVPGQHGPVLGRKFYYHQRSYSEALDTYRQRNMPEITVEVVPAGTPLAGSLRFVALSEIELDALIYTLILEPGTAHKLGYGKPLGLGSLQIAITRLEIEPRSATNVPLRFLSYGAPASAIPSAEVAERRDRAKQAWQQRPTGGSASHAAFTAIARWPQSENFVYPHFDFFRSERGRPVKQTLGEYQGRGSALHPGGAATTPSQGIATQPHTPAPTHTPPAQPTLQPPSERRRGSFDRRPDIGLSVQDEADEQIYQVRPTDAASRKLLRRLADLLDDTGAAPYVSFRITIDNALNGKQVFVAVDLVPEGAN